MTRTSSTTSDQNQHLVRSLYEEYINPGRLDQMSSLISPTFVSQTFTGVAGEKGPEEFCLSVAKLRAAIPDLHFTIEDIFAESDRVSVRWQLTGTAQSSASTGRPVRQPGIVIYHVQHGLIERAWRHTDLASLLQQIG